MTNVMLYPSLLVCLEGLSASQPGVDGRFLAKLSAYVVVVDQLLKASDSGGIEECGETHYGIVVLP